MKKNRKKSLVVILALAIMAVLTACTAVQISGNLVIQSDGSGSRVIQGAIAKNDHQDGYGSAYYYFKKHGADLEKHLKGIYDSKVEGSAEWLSIQVDDSGSELEMVTFSFFFSSFEDYTTKLRALAFDAAAAEGFVDPVFEQKEDGAVTYTESRNVMTAIYKSLQNTIMADDSIYDPKSTKDGTPLNDGSADGQIEENGVELVKPENGNAFTIQVNDAEAVAVTEKDGIFTYNVSADGKEVVEEKETSCVLKYTFDDVLTNAGTEADNDLIYGQGSTDGSPVFSSGVEGNAIKLDGKTYLASPNKSYTYDEMTVSFYYNMDAYTKTDSGANMVIVPAGLGALGAGVIDVEFIEEGETAGVQLLGKMNSSDWQTQDKLYSEGYRMDAHLKEWHNYTYVFQNEYDEEGTINDAFVFLYIDGKPAAKARLSVAAGLPYSLGSHDDGSSGTANGGFNIGGYFEDNTVKRACTGMLDNFMVFDGALTQEEIQTLCYTQKVEKEYDPSVVDTAGSSGAEPAAADTADKEAVDEAKEPVAEKNNNVIYIVIAVVAVLAVGAVVIVYSKKKKK